MSEQLERATLDSDENGFTLVLETDESPMRCRRFDHAVCRCASLDECETPERQYAMAYRFRVAYDKGRELLDALEPLREHIAEGERERAAYLRASDAERDAVLGRLVENDAYALDDPKSAGYHDRMADLADTRGAR